MRRRRALLYVPGDDLHKIQKAAGLGVDCVCLDMEDGVALNAKEDARRTIAEALQTIEFGKTEKLVRVNPFNTGLTELDLDAVLEAHPDGIILPKVDGKAAVQRISRIIAKVEKANGWKSNGIALIAIVESARGILNLAEICTSDRRLQAIIFGGEDLAADIGAIRTKEADEIFLARSLVVLHAAVNNLQAIDLVDTDFHDIEVLMKEARQSAEMGYEGKQIIHPAQVEPVQAAFTPDEAAVKEAQEIVRLAEEHQANGKGAFAIAGKMVDMPVVKRAQNILRKAGLLNE